MASNDSFKTILVTSSIVGIVSGIGYLVYELVRPKTLKDLLIWEGKQVLSRDNKDKKAVKKWNRLISQYGKKSNASKIFGGLTLSKKTVHNKQERIKQLQDRCEQELNVSIQKSEETSLKEQVTNWCTGTSDFAKGGLKKQKER